VDGSRVASVGDQDEVPIAPGRHDIEIQFDGYFSCTTNLKLYPGHLRWVSCSARSEAHVIVEPVVLPPAQAVDPFAAPPEPPAVLVDPQPAHTAMRLTLLPYGTVGSLYIDDQRIGWASDGMEIPLKPGSHYIKVVFDNGDVCIKALGLRAGQLR